jgi:8-oxo-dGTP pyrophosphatase MutT (NUDIX family)
MKNNGPGRAELLKNTRSLTSHVTEVLAGHARKELTFPKGLSRSVTTSAVMFPLGRRCVAENEPCVLFNKRSIHVKQAGDLCFPGGGTSPSIDSYLSKILRLPLFPLARWPHWSRWRREKPEEARRLSLLLATSLRESFEEMRLNPLAIRFLGPLPSHDLASFQRVIYPMVGWIAHQKSFFPNWEVERIVPVPLGHLLDPEKYACYRLQMGLRGAEDFPCFRHFDQTGKEELLWGATYRIVTVFLELIFGFRPPPMKTLPVVYGALDQNYLQGRP